LRRRAPAKKPAASSKKPAPKPAARRAPAPKPAVRGAVKKTAPVKAKAAAAAAADGESPSQAFERAMAPLYGLSSNPRSQALAEKYSKK